MEKIIASYLSKNRSCPLPEIGTLKLISAPAVGSLAERKIHPPVFSIKLEQEAQPAIGFIKYIADCRNVRLDDAAIQLKEYCSSLQNLDAFKEARLPHIGKFYLDSEGNLLFKATEAPQAFLPVIQAERVIHPQSSHNMRVGDLETTSAEMTAYYSDADSASRSRWWIAALILFIAGIAAITFYYNDPAKTSTFGNQQKVQTKEPGVQYRVAE